jgi:hypothetical protein
MRMQIKAFRSRPSRRHVLGSAAPSGRRLTGDLPGVVDEGALQDGGLTGG